jgi:hypothetical protein
LLDRRRPSPAADLFLRAFASSREPVLPQNEAGEAPGWGSRNGERECANKRPASPPAFS